MLCVWDEYGEGDDKGMHWEETFFVDPWPMEIRTYQQIGKPKRTTGRTLSENRRGEKKMDRIRSVSQCLRRHALFNTHLDVRATTSGEEQKRGIRDGRTIWLIKDKVRPMMAEKLTTRLAIARARALPRRIALLSWAPWPSCWDTSTYVDVCMMKRQRISLTIGSRDDRMHETLTCPAAPTASWTKAITSHMERINWCAAISTTPIRVAMEAINVQAPTLHKERKSIALPAVKNSYNVTHTAEHTRIPETRKRLCQSLLSPWKQTVCVYYDLPGHLVALGWYYDLESSRILSFVYTSVSVRDGFIDYRGTIEGARCGQVTDYYQPWWHRKGHQSIELLP